jgi:RNA polymerase sigma-70 factor (ECF subfamily)
VNAWDELVEQWNDRLMYYLRRLINDEHEAANAVQEVWLGAFRSLNSLGDGARLAPWLYTIARRTAMNHLRDKYATPLLQPLLPEHASTEDDEQLTFDNAELVHFGLAQLGLCEREVLTLYFLNDLAVGEIAELLEIPPGTVKSRLHKARGDLRRVLEKQEHCHDK